MITLVLEAATYEGSVALLNGPNVLGERVVAMRGREHEALMAAVGDLLGASDVPPGALSRVVCGAGPGSFTSLRIAGSIAKGLCFARRIPLVPVSSLTLLAASSDALEGRLLAVLDAMRGESYVQLHEYAPDGSMTAIGEVEIHPAAHVADVATRAGAVVVGPGAQHHHAVPRAGAARRITKLLDQTPAADLAAWEPGYGRRAEAQVKWESEHGRPLPA